MMLLAGVAIASVIALNLMLGLGGQRLLGSDRYQVRRKIQHATSGIMIVFLAVVVVPGDMAVQCLGVSVVGCGLVLACRPFFSAVDAFYLACAGPLLRQHERKASTAPGAFWLLLAAWVLMAQFPLDVASLSLLFVSVGDPAASLFGMLFGDSLRLSNGKSPIGTLACVISCLASAVALSAVQPQLLDKLPVVSVVSGAVAAALVELLPIPINDNFSIPLVSAAVLTALR
jgi:diacylglycerol kinase (CTP)